MASKSKHNRIEPKACVFVVCENDRDFICDTLNSIAKNDYEPLHVVLVDNDSEDGTFDMLCEKLGIEEMEFDGKKALPPKFDSEWNGTPITVVRKRRSTTGHSINVGLGVAPKDTQFFVMCPPTDLLSAEKISKSVEVLRKYNFIGCVITDCYETHGPTSVRVYNRSSEPHLLLGSFPYDANFVVPRQFIRKFNESMPCGHEIEFILGMGEKAIIYVLPEALYSRKPLTSGKQKKEVELQIKKAMGIA